MQFEEDSSAVARLSLPLFAAHVNKRRAAFLALGLAVLAVVSVVSVVWYLNKTKSPPKINSMAVLPLRPLTDGENNKALGLGLADTLIMRIGGLRQTIVRPISAVTPYTETTQDSLEIGRRLNVDAILEGTIQQFEGRVRLNARLLLVENGEQIWAEQFKSDAAQIFDLQDV